MKIGSKISNIHVDSYSSFTEKAAIGWDRDGARFHVWIFIHPTDRTNWLPEDVVYKNPPLGVEYKAPGHFDTRKLDRTKPINQAIYREVAAFVNENGLVAQAIAAEAEKVAAEQRAQAEAARIYAIQDAGVDLYEALCHAKDELVRARDQGASIRPDVTYAITEAIAKAEGRTCRSA